MSEDYHTDFVRKIYAQLKFHLKRTQSQLDAMSDTELAEEYNELLWARWAEADMQNRAANKKRP